MKIRNFLRNKIIFVLTFSVFISALLIFPANAGASGITPAEIDTMAADPQSWKLQRDMTWGDLKPNPVIDWSTELNNNSLEVNTPLLQATGRKIRSGLILVEYLDRKFISGQPQGSDSLGYKLFNANLTGGHGSYEAAESKNPVSSVLDYPSAYTGGYNDLPLFWADYLGTANTGNNQKPLNHGVTADTYWLENSFGKWGVDLVPQGIYTIPYFEFEVMGLFQSQTWRDIPPSFRYGTPAQSNPSWNGTGATRNSRFTNHAIEIAKRGGAFNLLEGESENPWGIPTGARGLRSASPVDFDNYDSVSFLHAGYDQYEVLHEFGEYQYSSRQAVPWDLGPGPRLLEVEKFFNDYPEWVPIYAARYANGWANYQGEWNAALYNVNDAQAAARVAQYRQTAFWSETLSAYETDMADNGRIDTFIFRLPQEDWDWANAYHGKDASEGRPEDVGIVNSGTLDYLGMPHYKNNYYSDFTSWEAAVSQEITIGSINALRGYGGGGGTKNIRYSIIGENDGTGFLTSYYISLIGSISTNHTMPDSDLKSPFSETWDITNTGETAGPFGDHARWAVMPTEGGTVPVNATQNTKSVLNFYDGGDILDISIDVLAAGTPVIVNVAARNVPIDNEFYPSLGVPAYDNTTGAGFVKGLRLNFADNAARVGSGYTNFHTLSANNTAPALNMGVEVVQQSGSDSFAHDSGVMLTRVWNTARTGNSVVDSHLYDIGMTDYFRSGQPSVYTIGHPTQMADALFKAGKSMTDTGYYGAVRDAAGALIKPGSEWRWEPRDNRPISGGDSVNEWRDEANGLHFYILSKQSNPSKYGEFLSYKVAARHDDGAAVVGQLSLSVKPGGEAAAVDVGNYAKQTYVLTNTGATETDIVRIGLAGTLAEGRMENVTVDMTPRNQTITDPAMQTASRAVPKLFSQQNAVILNDLYSIGAGESVEFDVYIKQVDANTITNLDSLLTVTAASETNSGNYALLPADSVTPVTLRDIGGVTPPVAGAIPALAVAATNEFTGTVEWSPFIPNTFNYSTVYTATITLKAAAGYTFEGVPANSFTVAGASSVSNNANSGVITAVFPVTGIGAVRVTGVTIEPKTVSGFVGEEKWLTATVSPANAANKTVYWSSDNDAVSAYGWNPETNTGLMVLSNAGTATITVWTADGSFTDTCVVTVTDSGTVPVTGVTLTPKTVTVSAGSEITLNMTVSPADATLNTFQPIFSNPSVATVSGWNYVDNTLRVYGMAPGTTRMTVRMLNGGFEDYCDITVTDSIRVTGVTVEPETLSGVVGGSQQLTAAVFPADAANKTVYWLSDNYDVAVPIYTPGENTAYIDFRGSGMATITAGTQDGSFTDICIVTVTDSGSGDVRVTGVTVEPKTVSGVVGGYQQLTATVSPADATNKAAIWSSNNDAVHVSGWNPETNTAYLTFSNAGTATITASTLDGNFTDTSVITVTDSGTVPVTGVTVTPKTVSVGAGSEITLDVTVSPADATLKEIDWSSSNDSIARVISWSNFTVTVMGVSPGTARITVRTLNGGFEDYCDVTVTENGTIRVTGVTVEPETVSGVVGGSQTLTATVFPVDAANKIVYWSSSNENVTNPSYMPGENTAILTFNNPGTAVITARTADGSFTDTCVVTVSEGSDSQLYLSPSKITAGKDNTFTVTFKVNSPQVYNAVEGQLEFDPNYLEFVSADQIPPASVWTFLTDSPNSRQFAFMLGTLSTTAVMSEDTAIAAITFRALAETSGTDIRIVKLPDYGLGSSLLQYQGESINNIDFSVRNTSVAITEGTATLKASFQSRPATGAANIENLAVKWIRDNAVIAEESVTTDENGQAQILVPMPNDGLSIWVKGERTLSVVKQVGTVANASVVDVGVLPGGDSNGDNGVNLIDFGTYSRNFNKKSTDPTFNKLADYNNDGGVNLTDFGVFSRNFNKRGAALPAGYSAPLGTMSLSGAESDGGLYAAEEEETGGSSGCNSAVFAVFTLLIITPLFKKRR